MPDPTSSGSNFLTQGKVYPGYSYPPGVSPAMHNSQNVPRYQVSETANFFNLQGFTGFVAHVSPNTGINFNFSGTQEFSDRNDNPRHYLIADSIPDQPKFVAGVFYEGRYAAHPYSEQFTATGFPNVRNRMQINGNPHGLDTVSVQTQELWTEIPRPTRRGTGEGSRTFQGDQGSMLITDSEVETVQFYHVSPHGELGKPYIPAVQSSTSPRLGVEDLGSAFPPMNFLPGQSPLLGAQPAITRISELESPPSQELPYFEPPRNLRVVTWQSQLPPESPFVGQTLTTYGLQRGLGLNPVTGNPLGAELLTSEQSYLPGSSLLSSGFAENLIRSEGFTMPSQVVVESKIEPFKPETLVKVGVTAANGALKTIKTGIQHVATVADNVIKAATSVEPKSTGSVKTSGSQTKIDVKAFAQTDRSQVATVAESAIQADTSAKGSSNGNVQPSGNQSKIAFTAPKTKDNVAKV